MAIAPAVAALVGDIDFDPDALKARYLAERDKRLRTDGIGQYVEVTAEFSRYVDDPYVEPGFTRAPVSDHVEAAVIGGGFGGLLMAARLREAGLDSLRMVDRAGDFGGTWYWNRYPGAMCDVESYCYLPLLEELGYLPKHKYSFAPEILEHSRRIARHYRLYDDALLQTGVTELRWDEESSVGSSAPTGATASPRRTSPWRTGRCRGRSCRASRESTISVAIRSTPAAGTTGTPAVIPAAVSPVSRDKRVGIVGTGATAIQCIPHLGQWAQQLYVFQRTPSSVDVRNNARTDPAWAETLTPGWQRRRMENFTTLVSGGDADEDLVGDGWTDIYRNLTGTAARLAAEKLGRPLTSAERAQLLELADYRKMNQIRARVDAIVDDAATAEALKPWYRQFCKRPCFHDEYLDTYNRPNVTLVDTDGKGVERLTPHGVVAAGREYRVDCLIFATGFEVGTAFTRRAGYDIVGRGGRTLSQHWSEGLRTLHGFHSHGFPNCFFLGFTQTAVTVNVPHALDEQARHVAYVIGAARDRGKRVVEATAAAEQDYVEEVRRLAHVGERFYAECTPGYYNSEGAPGNRNGFFSDMYGAGPLRFFELLEAWRADGALAGLDLR